MPDPRAERLGVHPGSDHQRSAGELALIEIRSTGDALQADATLPCGATLTATSLSGAYVKASFTLGARAGSAPQSGCSGAAAVDFLIRKGRIERWLRVAAGSGPAEPAAGSTSV